MKVNGIALENVDIVEKKITTKDITNVVENANTILTPYTDREEHTLGEIDLKLGIFHDTRDGLEVLKSKIIYGFNKAKVEFEDLEYIYEIAYINKTELEEPFINILTNQWYVQVEFFFQILKKYKSEKTATANKVLSSSITYNGTEKGPAIIQVTPSIDLISFTITGLSDEPIILKNIKKATMVTIDGINKKVIRNNVNDFINVEMWDFPRLLPGENPITFSTNSCNVTIKYNEVFN